MPEGNPLVDKDATTNWQGYSPFTWNSRDGYGPIMPGPGADDTNQHWLSGIPIDGSVENLVHDIQQDDTFSYVFDSLSAALETASFVESAVDATTSLGGAVGFLAQPLIAWILDHVKPLRLVLDELVGNSATVKGVSKTWTNMGKALGEAANNYGTAAQKTQEYWQGKAADAYRKRARALAIGLNSLGLLCEVWANLLAIVSQMVQAMHNLVRDVISGLVATLIKLAIDSIGEGPPPVDLVFMAKDGIVYVVKAETIVAQALTSVGKGMTKALSIVAKVLLAIRQIATAIKNLIQFAQQGGTAAAAPS
ncbi:hypothetical protein [Amycolatopsis sp. CA-230715]|uniref:hypothetical protein n=1 Tax=Amycolatopsis sp. CA-230715 TaxID=2745196 RepID=UPI001C02708B|nr:hypothetical protein [Amycolatopsis sp. CA-230715]QWF84342.1 hypothetical protein HUW46_07792 [Amycolatopsis sp. CA-230715]